jgi:hypothetical protein
MRLIFNALLYLIASNVCADNLHTPPSLPQCFTMAIASGSEESISSNLQNIVTVDFSNSKGHFKISKKGSKQTKSLDVTLQKNETYCGACNCSESGSKPGLAPKDFFVFVSRDFCVNDFKITRVFKINSKTSALELYPDFQKLNCKYYQEQF